MELIHAIGAVTILALWAVAGLSLVGVASQAARSIARHFQR